MTESREDKIRRAILQALAGMDKDTSAEGILFAAVELLVNPRCLVSEFTAQLKHCEQHEWIIGHYPPMGQIEWTLTNYGRTALAESR